MKKVFAKIALRGALAVGAASLVLSAIPAVDANAVPPLNPLCWIADTSIASVRKNCQGHDWRWPHWGGNGNTDRPARACGGGNIYSDAWWMSAADLRQFNYGYLRGTQGVQRSELILTNWYKNVRSFRSDEMVYTWESHHTSWVWYDGVGYVVYYTNKKVKTVVCNMNGQVK